MTNQQFDELISFRKEIHAHPEVSGEELETSKRVHEMLLKYQPSAIHTSIGKHGIVAEYSGKQAGKTLLFRAELDALPIHEINEFEHRSKIDGVGHKCGHDGHLTSLLAVAKLLHENPLERGKVLLLFQPAEEDGRGADWMLSDPQFNFKPDFVFAYHNLPGYPLNQIVTRKGSFTAAVTSIIFKLKGKTAHAAEPEHGYNPALAIAQLIEQCLMLEKNNINLPDFNVITPVHITLGEKAYGVSADYGEVHFTVRTWEQDTLNELTALMQKIGQSIAINHHLELNVEFTQQFHANKCDDVAVDCIDAAAEELYLNLGHREHPFKWGEDFGLFTQQFSGAMFGIGAGEKCPALHNPDYDFPDEIIPIAAALIHKIIKNNC